mmetsp:Transcript_129569/g.361017  ORF Transcript_129569/g.361017 Transcript_129569/m.361017 type:complete len:282 (+) Transcript_129569:336-1181(+)
MIVIAWKKPILRIDVEWRRVGQVHRHPRESWLHDRQQLVVHAWCDPVAEAVFQAAAPEAPSLGGTSAASLADAPPVLQDFGHLLGPAEPESLGAHTLGGPLHQLFYLGPCGHVGGLRLAPQALGEVLELVLHALDGWHLIAVGLAADLLRKLIDLPVPRNHRFAQPGELDRLVLDHHDKHNAEQQHGCHRCDHDPPHQPLHDNGIGPCMRCQVARRQIGNGGPASDLGKPLPAVFAAGPSLDEAAIRLFARDALDHGSGGAVCQQARTGLRVIFVLASAHD